MTLEEIAKLASVSRSTVSRVINNHPSVSDEVRERVWQVIEEQDFHPNTAARMLAGRRSRMLGLVIPQALSEIFSDPYFPLLIQGISAACDARQHYLMLSLLQMQSADAYRRIIQGGHLDGLIVASAFLDDSFVQRLQQDDFPFVLIGRQPSRLDINTVDADNSHGAMMAAQHFARIGYTRIATITGPLNMVASVDRRDGFLAGLRLAGLSISDGQVIEGDFSEQSGYDGMMRLLMLGASQRPQAVFVASDRMAIGALKAARAAGLRVPDDVALIGFDDIPMASAVEPTLTTVRQPIERLGYTAAAVLIDLLAAAEGSGRPQRVVLPTELVIRESCGHDARFRAHRPAPIRDIAR